MKLVLIPLVFSIMLISCGGGGSKQPPAPGSDDSDILAPVEELQTRSFTLGFTPFPYDITVQARDDVYDIIREDADIIIHHMDNGIPWNEALADDYPYHDNIMGDWSGRLEGAPVNHEMLVIVTPINPARSGLANYRKEDNDMPLISPFDTYHNGLDFDHEDVKKAYLNYCKRAIDYFSPDYFGIGIEVNLIRKLTDDTTWNKYMNLQTHVYQALKVSYPDLPILASVEILEALPDYPLYLPDEFTGDAPGYEASQKSAISDVLSASDYLAISIYPHKTAFHESAFPDTMFDDMFALSEGKPIAIAETGMTAESFSAFTLNFEGSEEKQNNYLSNLLEKSNEYGLHFVSYFVAWDYDKLCLIYEGGVCPENFLIWKDTGLYDGNGEPRQALATWREYLAMPYEYAP